MQNNTKRIALGGMLAGVAVVIMCLGGLIPVATYICPMLCCLTQFLVLCFCGRKLAWTWFFVVCVLSLAMGPDKEAASVFLFLGFYPIVKPQFDRLHFAILPKLIVFNVLILTMYGLLIRLFGMDQIAAEFAELGQVLTLVMLLLGNVIFLLLDRVLTRFSKIK